MPFAHLLSGLRARLIVLVLAAVLPASILLIVSSFEQRQTLVDKQRDGALASAKLLASFQGNVIASTRQRLEWIAQFPEVQSGDPETCNRRLEQLLASSQGIRGLLLADPQGNTLCAAPRNPNHPTFNIAKTPAFSRAVEQNAFVIGSVATGTLSGRPNLTFGLPITDANGRLKSVITIGLNVDDMQASLSEQQVPDGGVVMVMDATGVVLGRAPDGDEFVGRHLPNTPVVRAVLSQQSGVTETAGLDGVERLYAFAPYELNGQPALYAVVGLPTTALYAQADQQLRRNLLLLVLFAALTMLAAWLAGDIMIVRRARSVMGAASRLRKGDLSARAGGPYGTGELSTLARDFDAMASRLEQRQRERDQAMRDQAASKDRYQLLVSAVSSIVWTADVNGHGSEPSLAWETFTGQRWPDYATDGGFAMVHPADQGQLAHIWQEAFRSGTPIEAEYRLWHAPSAQYRHVQLRGMPILDEGGHLKEWTGIIADIHERKQAEQERQLLLDVSDALTQSRDEMSVWTRLVSLLAPASADWCAVARVDEKDNLVRVAEFHAADGETLDRQTAGPHHSVPLAKAVELMECLRTHQVQLIERVTPEVLTQWHADANLARQLDVLQQRGLQQLMFVPVILRDQPAALITLGIAQSGRRFDDSSVALMTEVARRIGLTLENQRLYREERESRLRAERNAHYLSRLQAVSSELALLIAPSIQLVSEAILDALMRSFGATTGAISTVSEDVTTLDLVCTRGYAPEVVATFTQVVIDGWNIASTEVVRTGEPVWVLDQVSYLQRYPIAGQRFVRFNDQACAVVPMKQNQRVIGVIALNFDQPRDFSAEDKDILMALGTQGAQAIERARLFEEEQQSRRRAERNALYLSRLQAVSAALSALPEPGVRQFTEATLDAIMQSFGASTGAISMVTSNDEALEVVSARGYTPEEVAGFKNIPIGSCLTAGAMVAATGEPVWVRNNAEYLDRFPHSFTVYQRGSDNACAVVPMRVGQRIAGVIALNFDHERDFSAEDKDLLLALSTQCGQALERLQLYEESQQLNQQLEARVQARTRQLETSIVQLRKSREQLHELSGQLLAAVEEERRRIAQEVHDELGQALTVIKMDLGFVRRKLDGTVPDVAARLGDTTKYIDETIRIMRRIATDLRPGVLDSLGLEAAVESLVQEFGERAGIACSLVKESNDNPIFDKDISISAYRIVQEALTNIARHSHATEVDVTYIVDDARLFIEIHDNGVGIPDTPETGAKSLGLRGMRERARHVHGEVTVQGTPGKGTTVTLEIALNADAGEAQVMP